jgi:AraC family transcriptional regulator, regulatory protein of adaptative response / methylated-DNA-[protein]-cysteine methyltransferase
MARSGDQIEVTQRGVFAMTLNSIDRSNSATVPHEIVGFAFGTTSFGQVLVAATRKGICAILLGGNRERLIADLHRTFPQAQPNDAELARHVAHVVAMIEKPAETSDLLLDLHGSDFEIKVWQALRAIPAGKTMSYSELAEHIGMKGAAKDVGEACASNRIAIAVPCHRILRKDGSISGYRWGVHRKRALLEREAAL